MWLEDTVSTINCENELNFPSQESWTVFLKQKKQYEENVSSRKYKFVAYSRAKTAEFFRNMNLSGSIIGNLTADIDYKLIYQR